MSRILWRAGGIWGILEAKNLAKRGKRNVHFETLLYMCRIGTGVIKEPDSEPLQHTSIFIETPPAVPPDACDAALIRYGLQLSTLSHEAEPARTTMDLNRSTGKVKCAL